MIVCVCKNIKTSEIHEAIGQGACRIQDLTKKLGVASGCGKCAEETIQILKNKHKIKELINTQVLAVG